MVLDAWNGLRSDHLLNRREVLRLGGVAGLSALTGTRAGAEGLAGFGRARSCLIVFLAGGPSHLDTFDPKPDAPAEIRGPFDSIATAVPGLRFCEHLPGLARIADRLTVIRSLSHGEGRHDEAVQLMLTGHDLPSSGPGDSRGAPRPHVGSTVASLAEERTGIPPFVTIPDYLSPLGPVRGGQGAGILGARFEPLLLRGNPNRADFDPFARLPSPATALRRAAQVGHESLRLRERYGRDLFGQSLLFARRLVEAGVKVVQVNAVRFLDRGWDTHADAAPALRDDLLPSLDRALSSLLEDLAASGLLEETLVVVMGEFGRTPRITAGGGRGHWPDAFSILLAGAGIAAGRPFGATDRDGAFPVDRPVSPGSLAATILFALGVNSSLAASTVEGVSGPRCNERPVSGLWS